MRRSAISVASNIAEGAARNTDKEFIQFLYITMDSIAELETQYILSKELQDSADCEQERRAVGDRRSPFPLLATKRNYFLLLFLLTAHYSLFTSLMLPG